jgi:hypothetical protein
MTGLGGSQVDPSKFMSLNQGNNVTNPGGTMFGQFDQGGFQGLGIGNPGSHSGFQMPGAVTPPGGNGWSFLDKTNDKTGMTTQGLGSFGLSALQAGAGLYFGNKQMGLAEDQFAEAKRQFGKNFGSQVKNYNTNIEDRQNRRYIGAGGSGNTNNPYENTATYMEKNRMVA